jgi:hypothetical protein
MKSLIAITVLIALMIISSSIAQCDEKGEPALLAKAGSEELSISKIDNAHEKMKSSMQNEPIKDRYSEKGYQSNADPKHSGAVDSNDRSRDISLLIKKELNLEKNLDLKYRSPKLKAEQMPLVMSSRNTKIKGVVFPAFLYLKKQF